MADRTALGALRRQLAAAQRRLSAAQEAASAATQQCSDEEWRIHRLEADLRADPSHVMEPWRPLDRADRLYPEPGCRRCGCTRSSINAAKACEPFGPVLRDARGLPYQPFDSGGGQLITECCQAITRAVGNGKVACLFCGTVLPDEWARGPILPAATRDATT